MWIKIMYYDLSENIKKKKSQKFPSNVCNIQHLLANFGNTSYYSSVIILNSTFEKDNLFFRSYGKRFPYDAPSCLPSRIRLEF